MADYSTRARQLAAASRRLLSPRKMEVDFSDLPDEPGDPLPDSVPLDRRRNVPLDMMSDEDLQRALEQAEKRVDRELDPTKTTDNEKLDRYNSYLDAILIEMDKRQDQPAPPPVIEDVPQLDIVFGEDPEVAEERFRRAIIPEGEDDELESDIDRLRANTGVVFRPHPGDTPESDKII